ncbi:MAG: hypothetical protein ACMG6E_06805 [Candidatus Roizmanbacteria bacterium]
MPALTQFVRGCIRAYQVKELCLGFAVLSPEKIESRALRFVKERLSVDLGNVRRWGDFSVVPKRIFDIKPSLKQRNYIMLDAKSARYIQMHARHTSNNDLPNLEDRDLHFHLPLVFFVRLKNDYLTDQEIYTECHGEGNSWEKYEEVANILRR